MEKEGRIRRFLFGKIRRKILLAFIIVAFVLVILSTYFHSMNSEKVIKYEEASNLQSITKLNANLITTYLDEKKNDLILLSQTSSVIDAFESWRAGKDLNHTKEKFKEIRNLYEYKDILLISKDGTLILSSNDKDNIGINIESEQKDPFIVETYKRAKESGGIVISELNLGENTSSSMIYLASPTSINSKFLGYILIQIDPKKIYEITGRGIGLGKTGKIYIINKDRLIVSPLEGEQNVFYDKKINTENAEECFKDYEAYGEENGIKEHEEEYIIGEDFKGVKVLGTHAYVPQMQWCILGEIDYDEIISPIKQKEFIISAIIILFVLVSVAIVGWTIARGITKPITQLHNAVLEMEKGNFDVRTNINTNDELKTLGDSFNKMAENIGNIDKQYKRLDKAKTEFLSITSHELRSPMTPMKAQLQMLMEGYFGKLNEKQRNSVDIVLRNTTRLDKIIVDFLEISRIEAARLKFRFVKTDLTEHIKRLKEEMKGFMPEKNVEIVLNIKKLPIIEVDPDRAMQVLRNLINNAIKFSPENGKVFVNAELKGNMIQFNVKDQGIGLSEEAQQRIFEPFYQAEQTIYRKGKGTGLGLAICRGIVESQNGKIWVESQPGKGSTFYFTIPLTPVREVKPIKLLFSERSSIEKEVEELFKRILGPIGESEFKELLKRKMIDKNKLFKYIDELVIKNVINSKREMEFKKEVSAIFSKK